MDEQYGSETVLLDRVTDAAGVLSAQELKNLDNALGEFEGRFPQLFVAVYCGALPQQSSLRQFGFWLLNRAAISELDANRANENGCLLVLDVHGRSAALVQGYLLECYLSERENANILASGRGAWRRDRWGEGLCVVVRALGDRIRKRAGEAAKHPERFAPGRPPAGPQPPRFRRLRQGHRQAETESMGKSP